MTESVSSHSRRNLLTGDWVLVSPQRTERPWQGQIEDVEQDAASDYQDDCYLCPGNARAGGHTNPGYTETFVFDNDYPALSATTVLPSDDALLQHRSETGRCRVVCYTAKHGQRLATMDESAAVIALRALFSEFAELDNDPSISYVQMFENRGTMMGCSNLHPHAQIWATSAMPNEPAKERVTEREYHAANQRPLLRDYLDRELQSGERVVCQNDSFVSLVPFWATWPYETLIVPRQDISEPGELTAASLGALADALQTTLQACDSLFGTSTPYSMGFHPRPSDGEDCSGWIFHVHIYPPLLRSATVRKHMVGFEMLAMPQRDLTPELAAERLRQAID